MTTLREFAFGGQRRDALIGAAVGKEMRIGAITGAIAFWLPV